jgi:hypothetical protein
MRRARGTRIIGQADTLAVSSVGGPAQSNFARAGSLPSLFLLVGIPAVSELAVAELFQFISQNGILHPFPRLYP